MVDRKPETSPRLLIVEDDALVAEDLSLRLKELRYDVVGITGDGQEAIRLVESGKPDLVLMDIVLPGGLDGIETADRITRAYGVPVVFVTAYTDEAFIQRAKYIEPFGYVVKPVRTRELHAVVSMALYRGRLERQIDSLRWGANVCNHLSDAVIAVDREQRIAFLNEAAERLLNGKRSTFIGRAWDDRVLAFERSQPLPVASAFAEVLENGQRKLFDEELQLRGADAMRAVKVQLVPIGQGRKPPLGVAVVVRDLSGERASAVLRKERNFSSAVLDTIGSVVVVMNSSGDIVYFNRAAQLLTGYSEQEVLGRCVWDFLLAPEETAGVREVFSRLTSGDFPNRFENDWVTRLGERRHIAWNNSALQDSDGNVEYVIATGIDITEQRRAEKDLARVEMQWNEVIDFLADPICLVDLDDRVVRANRAFYGMIVKAPDQVIGHDIREIMHPDGEPVPCPVCTAREARREVTVVLEPDDRDNPVRRPVEITLRVIRDMRGEVLGFLMALRDLSDQRKVEAELRQHRDHLEELVKQRTSALENANRELESFSYSVSHDLRAPLRGIDGFSHALLEDYYDRLDEVGQGYLRRVRKASQRMGVLIDDLLELSRVGRNIVDYRWVDLSKIANAILREFSEGEPGQRLDAEVQPGMLACGDPTLLRLLLQNLLGNALKFSSVRDTSEITFATTEYEPGRIAFYVRDNGVGFDMTYAGKLFGAFQRLHAGQEFEGTGIGLATVQRIVHRHEGRVWAESRLNEGATFYFTLPETRCRESGAAWSS